MMNDKDNLNKFINELAPMKEEKFWHNFLLNLLCHNNNSNDDKQEFQLNPPPLIFYKNLTKIPDKYKAKLSKSHGIINHKPIIIIPKSKEPKDNIIVYHLPPPRVKIKFGRKITSKQTWIPPSSSTKIIKNIELKNINNQQQRQQENNFSLQKPLYSTIFIPKKKKNIISLNKLNSSSITTTTTTSTTKQEHQFKNFLFNNQSSLYFIPIQNSFNYYDNITMGNEKNQDNNNQENDDNQNENNDDTITPTETTATITPTNIVDNVEKLKIKDEKVNDDENLNEDEINDDLLQEKLNESNDTNKLLDESIESKDLNESIEINENNNNNNNNSDKKQLFESKSLSPLVTEKPPVQRSLSETFVEQQSNNNNNNINLLQKSPSRPIFTSSSFYDPEQHPTLEDQVKLCREIAKQLVSDQCCNINNKGRKMFEKRVEKSTEWITENEDSFQNYNADDNHQNYHERTITDGPPNLRLVSDPRHVDDINTVQGVNEHIIITQEAKTRDTCKNIVNDLTSPEVNPTRGKALFTKRAEKSKQWIIDDDNVADILIDSQRDKLLRNIRQTSSSSSSSYYGNNKQNSIWQPQQQQYQQWSTQSSPIPININQYTTSTTTTQSYKIPGRPIFSPSPLSSTSPISLSLSRPSSSLSIQRLQFRDFNARPKPFCRAY